MTITLNIRSSDRTLSKVEATKSACQETVKTSSGQKGLFLVGAEEMLGLVIPHSIILY